MGYIISLCKFAPVQSMKSYAGVALQLHRFLTQVLVVDECSHIGRFTPAEVSSSAHRKVQREWAPESVWTFYRREQSSVRAGKIVMIFGTCYRLLCRYTDRTIPAPYFMY